MRVGVIGLGVGTLAAYGREGDVFRLYELNPVVLDIAMSQAAVGKVGTYAREHLASYKAPRLVRLIDEMPLTMTLKVMKRELRRRLVDEAASQGAGGPRR